MKDEKDDQLWKEAKYRAGFKIHLLTYVIINGMLWILWYFTSGVNSYAWPIWPTVGWGIGVIFNYFGVYKFSHTAEHEYQKLKGNRHLPEGGV